MEKNAYTSFLLATAGRLVAGGRFSEEEALKKADSLIDGATAYVDKRYPTKKRARLKDEK